VREENKNEEVVVERTLPGRNRFFDDGNLFFSVPGKERKREGKRESKAREVLPPPTQLAHGNTDMIYYNHRRLAGNNSA